MSPASPDSRRIQPDDDEKYSDNYAEDEIEDNFKGPDIPEKSLSKHQSGYQLSKGGIGHDLEGP